jgi:hypothetical protein
MGGIRNQPWLVESMALLVCTSMVSMVLVLPWQERVVEAAQGDDREAKVKSLIQWSIWGSVVMIPLSVVAWLMVAKQSLVL